MVKSSVFSVEIPGVTLEVREEKEMEVGGRVNDKENRQRRQFGPSGPRIRETQLLPLRPLRSALRELKRKLESFSDCA